MQAVNPMGYKAAYQAYQKNKYETASPHKLILMLYEGALQYADKACKAIESGDVAEANRLIQKVQDILSELLACLNLEQGGEIAKNLRSLYMYMMDLLIRANIRKDAGSLREMIGLLQPIKESWEQIGKDVSIAQSSG